MIQRLALLAVVAAIAACSNSVPDAQAQHTKAIGDLRAKLAAARDTRNDFNERAASEEARRYMATPRTAEQWRATVDKVRDGDEIVVTAIQDGSRFYLVMHTPPAKAWASKLQAGTALTFTGPIGPERSLTVEGALREPEYWFEPLKVSRVDDKSSIEQPPRK